MGSRDSEVMGILPMDVFPLKFVAPLTAKLYVGSEKGIGMGDVRGDNVRFLIASAVLATAIPPVRLSVCPSVRPSVRSFVTRRYCVKMAARSSAVCTVG